MDPVNLYIKSTGFTCDSRLNYLKKECLKSPGQGAAGRKVTSIQLEEADLEGRIELLTECLERYRQQEKVYMIEILEMGDKTVEQWESHSFAHTSALDFGREGCVRQISVD